jgi:23S rRNA (adenine2503-C2)-methyltransferase
MQLKVLNSQIDPSVNFIEEQLVGFLESRFVRKCDEYFIAYLSSQTGCNRGCTFCHLTATGQTSFVDSSHNDFMSQAIQIFKHYRRQNKPAKWMHYNLMARGEPLANEILLNSGDELLLKLGQVAKEEGLPAKFNISTIMPMTLKKSLVDVFNYTSPTIYYSLYSTDLEWRKKWMPAAMDPFTALSMLKEYQDFSKKIVKIHFPFIAGENDSIEEVNAICDLLTKINLMCEFNLVRYNTASPDQGAESSEAVIKRNIALLEDRFAFKGKVQIIQRVGEDIFASCGLFAPKNMK